MLSLLPREGTSVARAQAVPKPTENPSEWAKLLAGFGLPLLFLMDIAVLFVRQNESDFRPTLALIVALVFSTLAVKAWTAKALPGVVVFLAVAVVLIATASSLLHHYREEARIYEAWKQYEQQHRSLSGQ